MRIPTLALATTLSLMQPLIGFQGLYIGGSGGGNATTLYQTATISQARIAATQLTVFDADYMNIKGEGSLFVGYGLKFSRFYTGIEGFARYAHPRFHVKFQQNADIDNNAGTSTEIFRTLNDTHIKIGPWHYGFDWRLGFQASARTLFYGRWGVEWTRIRADNFARFLEIRDNKTPTPILIANLVLTPSFGETGAHFRAGLGIETLLGPRFSLRADYLYTKYGTVSLNASKTVVAQGSLAEDIQIDLHNHAVTLGLSYYFTRRQPDFTRYQPCFPSDCCGSNPFCGFYLAAAIGGSLIDTKADASHFQNRFETAVNRIVTIDSNFHHVDGAWLGSATLGYGYQRQCLFLGLEAFANYSHHTRSLAGRVNRVDGQFSFNNAFSTEAKIKPLQFGIQLRPGYLINPCTLFYGTAGVSRAKIRGESDLSASFSLPVTLHAKENETRTAWRVGGGIEYAFCQYWHVRGDYIYTNYGSIHLFSTNSRSNLTSTNLLRENTRLHFRTHDISVGLVRYF